MFNTEIKNNNLHIEAHQQIGCDNEYISSIDGVKIKMQIDALKTIVAALQLLSKENILHSEIMVSASVVFLSKEYLDNDEEIYQETTTIDNQSDEERIVLRGVFIRLEGDCLSIAVEANSRYSTGTFLSSIGTIPLSLIDTNS